MPSKKLVLVTGASGFIGAQMVQHFLQAGYAVRGSCRSPKAEQLRKNCTDPDFQMIVVDDLVKGDLSAALRDVHSVVHVASPLPLPGHEDNFFEVSVEGTLNLLQQAHAANVHKIVIVGSIAATDTTQEQRADASRMITDEDWNTVTKEVALDSENTASIRYRASKTLAERAAWEFVESHPSIELTILLPPFIYGPLASAQVVTNPQTMLSTNIWVYMLISGLGKAVAYPRTVSPQCVDVRDVASAAVLSLRAKSGPGERRRILLWGGSFTWKQAVKHIASVRPMLRSRLVDGGEPPYEEATPAASIDTSKARNLLGLTDFISWEKTIEDTVDSLLERESVWTN